MNILLVYPEFPDTYWSFKHALKFISKKSANVPLGILTVASMLPEGWNKKLADLNVSRLKDKDIIRADFVFISAISVQSASVRQVIDRCRELQTRIVGGGPLFTEEHEHYSEIDHMVLNEAEITLPLFIEDLKNGNPQKIYRSDKFADLSKSPMPDYSLIRPADYATAAIQYTRGCPYDCDFCDITALFGRQVRTKTSGQIISELEQLFRIGWRGSVFFVDDNFIGHRKRLKTELLPAIISWMKSNGHPFNFITEASINMSDDNELMALMAQAGFAKVFVGIETPDENCLKECNKLQNKNRELIGSVNKIQQYGIEVMAGFIVGFDNDPPNIFQRQIDFIQKSGIITAMVGLLNAPRLSKLYKRLKEEGRLTTKFTGDNTDYSMNFIPVMDKDELLKGYEKIVHEIYSGKSYYERVIRFLRHYNPTFRDRISFNKIMALLKSILYLGILTKYRRYYWKLFFWSIFTKPKVFPLAVTYSIYGYHFRKVFRGLS
ncbi:MAG: B12-binding domain-containing radical SAM protein [Bacteroidales bacterium]|nr:B12-binding domain-containing radical SAM protein [Bacteroidales bacterium]